MAIIVSAIRSNTTRPVAARTMCSAVFTFSRCVGADPALTCSFFDGRLAGKVESC
jgi:hypothetical protein